ncbi:hypothetical protein HUZ36_00005, partial [Pseudoalteromonas sp. McH1-7]|uniref:hypothetical protein n=1 Tax=Pseudoalteromonas sp. McH1-7 TaxID=2745574 RepID=UPI001590FAFC
QNLKFLGYQRVYGFSLVQIYTRRLTSGEDHDAAFDGEVTMEVGASDDKKPRKTGLFVTIELNLRCHHQISSM